jgi:sugar phosphate permease
MPSYNRTHFLQLRWAIYTILVVAYMSVFFHRMAPGVVSADLMLAFSTTGAALGSLAAMYYYIYTAMQIPAGVLADTLGTRSAVTVGNLIAGGGSIVFGLAETFEIASAGRFLVGLGVSVVFVGLMKSNSVWFSERKYGFISGLTVLLGNVGSILAAGPLAAVLNVYSWRNVFVAIGFISIGLALISWLVVRNRPEDVGFPSLREMEGKTSHPPRERHWLHDLKSVVLNRRVWPGFWINFGMGGGLFSFAGLWGIPLLRDVFGLERGAAAAYTTLTLVGLAVGSLASGWLSDHLGHRKPVLIAGAVLYSLAWVGMLSSPWAPGVSGFVLFGLIGLTGAGFVVTYACAKEVCAPALSGMAISVVNTGLFLGAALMQPLFGWVLDQTWDGTLVNGLRRFALEDYRAALWLMLGFAIIALIGTLRLTETHCHNVTVKD